jgi:hypothetical protein
MCDGLGVSFLSDTSKNCKSASQTHLHLTHHLSKMPLLLSSRSSIADWNVSELVLDEIQMDGDANGLSPSHFLNASNETQGETSFFWFATNWQSPKRCSYSPKTFNWTTGRQGELVWDVSKALVKLGGRAMKGRRSSRWTRGGDGCATNFVRSFVLSLSREKLVRTKDRKNSYVEICKLFCTIATFLRKCNFFARLQLFRAIATFLHYCNFFVIIFYTSYLFPHTFMTYKCWTIICTI